MSEPSHLQTPPGCLPPAQSITREMLVSLLSDTLDSTFCQGPVVQAVNDGKTHNSTFMFQCKTVPSMTVKQYFQRLAKYTGVSGEAMILSMVHIARIYRQLPNFPVNILTIHRLLLTSVLVSAKFFDDSFLNNARYARVGGVTGKELNMLEVEFLFLIDFNLYISTDDYAKIFRELVTSNPILMKMFSLSPKQHTAPAPPGGITPEAKTPASGPSTPTPATPVTTASRLVANLTLDTTPPGMSVPGAAAGSQSGSQANTARPSPMTAAIAGAAAPAIGAGPRTGTILSHLRSADAAAASASSASAGPSTHRGSLSGAGGGGGAPTPESSGVSQTVPMTVDSRPSVPAKPAPIAIPALMPVAVAAAAGPVMVSAQQQQQAPAPMFPALRLHLNPESPFPIAPVRAGETPAATPRSNLPTPMHGNPAAPASHAHHFPPIHGALAPPVPPGISPRGTVLIASGVGPGAAADRHSIVLAPGGPGAAAAAAAINTSGSARTHSQPAPAPEQECCFPSFSSRRHDPVTPIGVTRATTPNARAGPSASAMGANKDLVMSHARHHSGPIAFVGASAAGPGTGIAPALRLDTAKPIR